jgi:cobalt-zinc-cadmium efflux system outer membrane protein
MGAGVLFVVILPSASSMAASLTLEQAWAIAERTNPVLRAAQARLDAAVGERTDSQSLLFNNPAVSAEAGRRRIRDGSDSGDASDWSVGIAQTFELFGQRDARREAAERTAAAVQTDIEEARRALRAEVERRFVTVLALQEAIELEQGAVELIDATAGIVRKRVAAGEDSRLEGNLATVEAERARNELARLGEQLVAARAALASVLQLPEDELPVATGVLDPIPRTYRLQELLDAVDRRPALRANDLRLQAARRRLDLERAARYPDLTVGISQAKEGGLDGRDTISTLSLSLPLPVFRRNAAGIGRAITEMNQASIERETAQRDARAQVIAVWDRRDKLAARLRRLRESVLPRLEENVRLSQAALQAGAIGLAEWILAQRQALEGRRDLTQARTDLRLLQVDLEAAAGVNVAVPTAERVTSAPRGRE